MDFLWAILFFFWCELLSLPLRWACAGWRAPADVRRMVSRLAGPPLLALPLWFLAHGGHGLLERGTGLAWLGLLAGLGLAAGRWQTRSAARLMAYEGQGRDRWREAGLDALMLALLLGFTAFRRWVPEMTTYQLDGSGAEKFANAMIFWSNWHARQMPPQDYWLAGTPLPYYYWGHFLWAWAARLGGFPPALALNLAFATMVTLTWSAAYLLARAARLPRGWAAAAALCVAWAGNPEAIRLTVPLLQAHGFQAPPAGAGFWAWIQAAPAAAGSFIRMVLTTPSEQWGYYDYWGPSRAIAGQNVVDEFPAFSAILGDFHSHHLALPWLTGWLALAVAGARWRGQDPQFQGSIRNPQSAIENAGRMPALRDSAFRIPQSAIENAGETPALQSAIRNPQSAILLPKVTWCLAWVALGAAAVLTNLWNLPLAGLGMGVMLAVAAWRWQQSPRRDWREMALQLASVAILGLVLWGGMRLLRSGAPLPLPKPNETDVGLLGKLPIKKLPPELRTKLANMFGMWGLPVLALALAAGASLLPERRRPRRWLGKNKPTMAHAGAKPANITEKVAPDAAHAVGRPGRKKRKRGERGPGESASVQGSQQADPSGIGGKEPVNPIPATDAGNLKNGKGARRGERLGLVLAGGALILLQAFPLGAWLPGGAAWFWAGVGLWIIALMRGRRPWMPGGIGIALLGGCLVLAGLEVAYLPDRFVGELVRYNSYFKFSYPVWPVLWVGAWVAARALWHAGLPWPARWAGRAALLAILPCAAVYTICAVPQRINTARYGDDPPRQPTLNAFDFIRHRGLDDAGKHVSLAAEADLLEYIREQVPAGDRIAEGGWPLPMTESPAYQYQGRVASLAGHPVPLGWIHHEQQWRGEAGYQVLEERNAEIDAFYRSASARELLRRGQALKVQWVVFGLREARVYGPGTLEVLKSALPVAFSAPEGQPEVYLFKVTEAA